MANNSVLKGTVNDYVKQNGAGGITGQGLQTILDTIIDSLGGKYQYAGVAVLTPTPTNPGTPDANVFYIASEPGTYTNFGGIVLTDGEVAVLKGSGSSWTKEVTGIASAEEVSQLGQLEDQKMKGRFCSSSAYEKCILNLQVDTEEDLTQHVLTLNYFGFPVPETHPDRFYIGILDITLSKVACYAWISVDTIPNSGITTLTFDNILGQAAGYTITKIRLTIDWSYFDSTLLIDSNITSPSNSKYIRVGNYSNGAVTELIDKVLIGEVASMYDNIQKGIFTMTKDWTLGTTIVTIPNNTVFDGQGHTITTQNDSSARIILGENSCIKNVKFVGKESLSTTRTMKPSSGGKYYYIYNPIITDYSEGKNYITAYRLDDNALITISGNNASIVHCTFKDFGGSAIKCANLTGQDKVDNISIINCAFDFCYCGIYNKGEFNRFSNNIFHGNLIAFISEAGNFVSGNSLIKMNDIGFVLYDNGNGGHSVFSGCEFAHCNRGVQIPSGIARNLGMVFTACHFADAPLYGYNANSILLNGCRLDCWFYTTEGALSCAAVGNIIRDGYARRDEMPIFSNFETLKANTAMSQYIQDNEINN